MVKSFENTCIAQGHTLWEDGIRKHTSHIFDGVEPSYLTTGLVSTMNGTSRNGVNIYDVHIRQMPLGEQFLECLTLPQGFWSLLRITSCMKCHGCNRTHRGLGFLKAKRCVETNTPERIVPILQKYGLQCAIYTALMSYYAEILGMYQFGYITDKQVAQQAINSALLNGTTYLEYCDNVRKYLMRERISMPELPQTEPYSIVPCLTIREREQYWSQFFYESLLGKTFERYNEVYRVENIIPIGNNKLDCFQCVHVRSGDNEPTAFTWEILKDWISKSEDREDGTGSGSSASVPLYHPPQYVRRATNTTTQRRGKQAKKTKRTLPAYKRLYRANKTRVRRIIDDTDSDEDWMDNYSNCTGLEKEEDWDNINDTSEESEAGDDSDYCDANEESEKDDEEDCDEEDCDEEDCDEEDCDEEDCDEESDDDDEDKCILPPRETIHRTTTLYHTPMSRTRRSTRRIVNYTD